MISWNLPASEADFISCIFDKSVPTQGLTEQSLREVWCKSGWGPWGGAEAASGRAGWGRPAGRCITGTSLQTRGRSHGSAWSPPTGLATSLGGVQRYPLGVVSPYITLPHPFFHPWISIPSRSLGPQDPENRFKLLLYFPSSAGC